MSRPLNLSFKHSLFALVNNPGSPIKSLPIQAYGKIASLSFDANSSINSLLLISGMHISDQDGEDVQSRLRLAESRADELAENLRTVTSSMEQYRAMAQSLEESLDKEKQVQTNCLSVSSCALIIYSMWEAHINFIY